MSKQKNKHSKKYYEKREAFLNKPGVQDALSAIAASGGFSVQELVDLIGKESAFNPKAANKTSRATGLIQFMPRTARGMGTSIEALAKMNEVDQLKYVAKYFRKMHKKGTHPYITVAYPKAGSYEPNKIIATKNSKIARQNPGWLNKDGNVTRASIEAFVGSTPIKQTSASEMMAELETYNFGSLRTPGNIDKVMSHIDASGSSMEDGFFEDMYNNIVSYLGGSKDKNNATGDAEHAASKIVNKDMMLKLQKEYLNPDGPGAPKTEEIVENEFAEGGYLQPNGRQSTFTRDEDLKAQGKTNL